VRWIGRRRIDTRAYPRPDTCRPIRIRRDAVAPGQPHRDLLVSPDHAVLLDGVLIPARLLVNGMTIVQDDRLRHADYFHVELDRHAILFAEGLESESYLDTGNRAMFANSGLPTLLHPDLSVTAKQRSWSADACAPLAVAPGTVAPLWQRLCDRAATLGFTPPSAVETTSEPDLHLCVAGRIVRAAAAEDGRYVFALPRGAGSAMLCSRAASAAEIEPFHTDRRRLGVAVQRLGVHLAGPGGFRDIAIDWPGLANGWWGAESAAGALWRWTNGTAEVPLPPDATMLEVAVRGRHRYPITLPVQHPVAAAAPLYRGRTSGAV
jgi:hypothetical protein